MNLLKNYRFSLITAAYNSSHIFPILSYFLETKIPRLKSLKPIWFHSFFNLIQNYRKIWRTELNSCIIAKKDLIKNPSSTVPDFDPMNPMKTDHGRCNSIPFK